ncbi:MAG: DUF447 family protein [Methanobacteriaceae archaeon]|nr:DUF447 family protein [Methanobacteriaceae archaeon]
MNSEAINLKKVGMHKGLLYETIITTKNSDNIPNAAPIGVLCKSENEIVAYLYQGSHTLENIKLQKKFIVNIVNDPEVFVECTLSDPSPQHFKPYKDYFFLKNCAGYFTAELTDMKEVDRKDKLGSSNLNIIKAQVEDIFICQESIKPFNRASFAIIESLIYFTRLELADEKTRQKYLDRIREMSRLVNKVGGLKHKKAMATLLNRINK